MTGKTKQNAKDDYYAKETLAAFKRTLEEAKGKSLEEKRYMLRRTYPFKLPRGGREYKIWRKYLLITEAELGLAPRKHKTNMAQEPEVVAPPKEAFGSMSALLESR